MVNMYETTPDNCNYEVVENCLSFGQALDKLIEKSNDKYAYIDGDDYGIRIRTWKDSIVIQLQENDSRSKMTSRYLYKSCDGKNIPWVPNNEFLFSNFWELVRFVTNEREKTINKMTASMYDNKNYEAWFKNPDIQKEFNNCRRKYEELNKDYANRNLVTKDKIENNDKCSPHCTKKCLNECHKAMTKPNNKVKAIVIKGNVKLVGPFNEIIDNLLR